ncbi:hypothetical protein M426DRAFT_24044 [Hypoxylon sp. CI-4A]|nr:hypothetical protein M426DRAFT_24044 [Hypoxylon sp. CI-4A]
MRISNLSTAFALVVPSLALPPWIERRQTVNGPWFITGWHDYGTDNATHKHTVRFEIGAMDAYVDGFYGFSGWCDPITVNWGNSTICFSGGDQWHVEAKVSQDQATNRTGLRVRHTQTLSSGKIVTATGSTDNYISTDPYFTFRPTDVEGF